MALGSHPVDRRDATLPHTSSIDPQAWLPAQADGSVRPLPASDAEFAADIYLDAAAQRQAATHAASHAANRARGGVPEFQARRVARRLEELERTNPHDIPIAAFHASTAEATAAGPLDDAPGKGKKKQTPNVRRLIIYKKTLREYINEMAEPPAYVLAAADPSPYPPRKLCSSCGYIGGYVCNRCGEYSCSRECLEVHEKEGGCGVGG